MTSGAPEVYIVNHGRSEDPERTNKCALIHTKSLFSLRVYSHSGFITHEQLTPSGSFWGSPHQGDLPAGGSACWGRGLPAGGVPTSRGVSLPGDTPHPWTDRHL